MDSFLKIILLSILLTLVYSWEECKYTFRLLVFGLLRHRHPGRFYGRHIDQAVGSLLMLATLPIGLTYLLVSDAPILYKLWWLVLQLLFVSLLAAGSAAFVRRIRAAEKSPSGQKIFPITYAVMGLLSPLFRLAAGGDTRERRTLAKFAFFLSLTPVVGIAIKFGLDQSFVETGLIPRLNVLIQLLVGALIIRITIEFLELWFRSLLLEKVFSYLRVLVGIGLALLVLYR